MDQFEKQFVNMESAMAGSTSLSTLEGEVNSFMQQVADDYGLEVSVGLPQPAAHAIPTKQPEKVDEDDLSRCLAELKARVHVYFRPRLLNVNVPSLTASIIASTSSENLFKIIEMVLGFMHDNLYTKAPLLYDRCGLALRVITFFLTSSVLVLFPVVVIHDKRKFSSTDVAVTYILLVGAIILELYSAVLILSSDQFHVWLIEHGKSSNFKTLKCFRTEKRWSNNMSQFSLLSFIIKEKPLPCPNILKHLRLYKRLEKQWYAADMEIPNNLKTLIGLYLREKEKHSQIGPTNSIPVDLLGLNFTKEFEKSIIAWHIATDIRYELDGEDIKQHGQAFELHCRLICQISRYMFYFVVLHPNMISDGSKIQITLPSILWAACSLKFTSKIEACQRFEELLTVSETYLNQLQMVNEEDNINDIQIFLKNKLPGLLRKLSEQFEFHLVYGALVLLVLVLSTLEGEVNSLMQQVADDYGLEVSVGLPQPAAHAIPTKQPEKVDEDDLSRRLAELKARG
ncbi:hypothetical protein LWI29_016812 [Acer saccharum]|uniref:DUF4220 domain-containing protein n=1 Tax=Acer saccharum TaxID=4024 RepID=A0AA39SVL4_ACESA|nr:hypothetical protein LWI29_016812 [Acer saccharum]